MVKGRRFVRRQRWRRGVRGRDSAPWTFILGLLLGAGGAVAVMGVFGYAPSGDGALRGGVVSRVPDVSEPSPFDASPAPPAHPLSGGVSGPTPGAALDPTSEPPSDASSHPLPGPASGLSAEPLTGLPSDPLSERPSGSSSDPVSDSPSGSSPDPSSYPSSTSSSYPQSGRTAEPSAPPVHEDVGFDAVDDGPPRIDRVHLVSDNYPSALAGDAGWDLHRTLRTDLNGDGRDETVHVLARVTRTGPGANDFAWDDGHAWNVYIEDEDGHMTYVFRGWVQLGELRVRSLDPFSDGGGRGLLLILEEGAGITLYRITYDGPDKFATEKLAGVLTWAEAW